MPYDELLVLTRDDERMLSLALHIELPLRYNVVFHGLTFFEMLICRLVMSPLLVELLNELDVPSELTSCMAIELRSVFFIDRKEFRKNPAIMSR